MNEPRPAMISARPPDSRSTVENSWKTRTGIVRAEDGDRARQPDPLRPLRRRREDDGRRRDHVVRTVVFADAEDIEADLVGELDLFHQVAHALLAPERCGLRSTKV